MHKFVHSATLYNSVFLFWSYLGPIGTIWDDLGRFGTIWDHWKPFGTIRTLDILAIWDHWGPFGTRLGPFGAIWDHLGPNWDHLGPFGTIWDHLGPNFDHLGPFGTIWFGMVGMVVFAILYLCSLMSFSKSKKCSGTVHLDENTQNQQRKPKTSREHAKPVENTQNHLRSPKTM